jgi:hypothetical protein
MKKLLYITLLAFLSFSCSSDDTVEEESLNYTILKDTWYFQRLGEICDGYEFEASDPFEFTFLSDNTVDFTDPGYLTSSNYTLIDDQLTLETTYTLPSGDTRVFIGNYTYSEETITFNGTSTFSAYSGTELLWGCEGTCTIFR